MKENSGIMTPTITANEIEEWDYLAPTITANEIEEWDDDAHNNSQ